VRDMRGQDEDAREDQARDELDHVLDAVLAKYAAIEPRAGLEERILAGLRTQPQPAVRVWWRWGLAGGAVAVVVIALGLAWRLQTTNSRPITKSPQVVVPNTSTEEPKIAHHDGNIVGLPIKPLVRRTVAHRSNAIEVMAATPKLDVFPSPQPPSDEELALARYVRDFPADAKVVAEAQANSEREVLAKMQALANESAESN